MADITAFPEDILPEKFGNYAVDRTYTAGADILSGQVVSVNADGNVVPATAGATNAIGVSLYGVGEGDLTDVRIQGAVYVANGDDTTAIPAGSKVTVGPLGSVAAATDADLAFGRTKEAIPGGGFGLITVW